MAQKRLKDLPRVTTVTAGDAVTLDGATTRSILFTEFAKQFPAIAINGTAGFSQPFYSQTVLSGSDAAPTGITPNLVYIPSDTYDAGGNFVSGAAVSHTFGGSATKGGRLGFHSYLGLSAPTSAANTNRNYVGGQLSVVAYSGDGGTNTGAGAQGAIFGGSTWADAQSGATNLLNVSGGEINVSVRAGASVRFKTGLQIADHLLDAVAGVELDAGLAITRQTGGIGFKHGINFGDFGGQGPTTAAGTLIGASNPNGTALTAANGVDLSGYSFSGNAWASTGATISGIGASGFTAQTIIGGTLANAASVLSISATQPTTPVAAQNAINIGITSAGSASQVNTAVLITYLAGYTGSSSTQGLAVNNPTAGTGSTLIPASGSNTVVGNISVNGNVNPTTTGLNVGLVGRALNGNINVGSIGLAQGPKNGATNIGGTFSAINTGTTPVQIGMFATLNGATPTVSAALIADNGSQSDPIARFRKAGVDVVNIDGSGNLLAISTNGIGYGTGAGGTVAQATSKSTGVTLNKTSGQVTMNAAALAANTVVSFVLTNSTIAATDVVIPTVVSGAATVGTYEVWAEKATAGTVTINARNISAGALSEALVVQFITLKGANA